MIKDFTNLKVLKFQDYIFKIVQKDNKEIEIYKKIKESKEILKKFFPKLLFFYSLQNFDILILENVGNDLIKNISTLTFFDLNKMFYDISKAIKYLHELNFVHRDIKPENILKNNNSFYLIDFNKSENLKNVKTNFTGNIKFCSLQLLKNKINGIFDISVIKNNDYVSLCYVTMFLYLKNLPWKSDNEKIKNIKFYIEEFQYSKTKDKFIKFLLFELKKYNEIF